MARLVVKDVVAPDEDADAVGELDLLAQQLLVVERGAEASDLLLRGSKAHLADVLSPPTLY